MKGRDYISVRDFSPAETVAVLDFAASMERLVQKKGTGRALDGKLVAVIFFEPSTRTRLSFEAAALRLGARVVSVSDPASSSQAKGETLLDTVRVVAGYADCIVLRQGEKGGARRAAEAVDIPLINAGDGAGEHPTQALLDLYTIRKETGRLADLTVAVVGDLKYGRTVHSLAYALAPFRPSFICCSPAELALPESIARDLSEKGVPLKKTDSLAEALAADVVYMTRIQRERFADAGEYARLKGSFVLTRGLVEQTNPRALILHPLPRVDEIAPDVDDLPNAAYFRQAHNGLYVRMALLSMLVA